MQPARQNREYALSFAVYCIQQQHVCSAHLRTKTLAINHTIGSQHSKRRGLAARHWASEFSEIFFRDFCKKFAKMIFIKNYFRIFL